MENDRVPFFQGPVKNLRINVRPMQTISKKNPRKEITCQRLRKGGIGDTETTMNFAVWNWENNEDIIVVIRTSSFSLLLNYLFFRVCKVYVSSLVFHFFNSVAQKLNVVSSSSSYTRIFLIQFQLYASNFIYDKVKKN